MFFDYAKLSVILITFETDYYCRLLKKVNVTKTSTYYNTAKF